MRFLVFGWTGKVGRKGVEPKVFSRASDDQYEGGYRCDIKSINLILVNRLRYFHKRACQEVHANGRRHHAIAVRQ